MMMINMFTTDHENGISSTIINFSNLRSMIGFLYASGSALQITFKMRIFEFRITVLTIISPHRPPNSQNVHQICHDTSGAISLLMNACENNIDVMSTI